MVSLAVLGLIAGLTVPGIVVSVQKRQNNLKKKEAVQLISEIVHAGVLNGDFASMGGNVSITNSTDPLVQYFTSKLNALQCPLNNTTYPCNHDWANLGVNGVGTRGSARWVLPNGTKIHIQGHVSNNTCLGFAIDTKAQGTRTHQSVDADQLPILCNISDSSWLNAGGIPIKSGTCGDHGYDPNAAHWNSVMK